MSTLAFRVLYALKHGGPMTDRDIAKHAGCSQAEAHSMAWVLSTAPAEVERTTIDGRPGWRLAETEAGHDS